MSNSESLPLHMQQLHEERQNLKARISSACEFAGGSVYLAMSSYDRTLFDIQLATMNDYLRLLSKRIDCAAETAMPVVPCP
ncbi:hypothetical protein [Pantoea sp. ICBG 1758]|uniref:crAss001_48 related protein n=1 Tax=Pantoea sp. ICBG 1758 TaxID=2071682 RepID=UPI0011B05C08|nr:hypothetical protein [Pantoea sp. ICBG 1758]